MKGSSGCSIEPPTESPDSAIPKYRKFSQPLDTQRKKMTAPPVLTEKRTIREINIPIKQDEELRSVNDQLRKKLPAGSKSWEQQQHPHDDSGNVHPYPLNPIYKSNSKSPSQSDPVLNNWYDNFHQAACSHTTTTSPTSPTPKNKSTLVTTQEKAKYIQHINHSNAAPTKKPSLLLSSIGFFKKKKSAAADNPRNKKRLSLSHAATDPLIATTQTSSLNHTKQQQLDEPPSPMFSPIDFYYSPADIDRNLKKPTTAIIPPSHHPPTSP